MYTKNDIVARLRKGESLDAIADEFSELLNAADKTYQEEQVKEAAKRERQERRAAVRLALIDVMREYLAEYELSDDMLNVIVDACDKAARMGAKWQAIEFDAKNWDTIIRDIFR